MDPNGQVMVRAGKEDAEIIYAELEHDEIGESSAKRHFLKDKRPYFYSNFTVTPMF